MGGNLGKPGKSCDKSPEDNREHQQVYLFIIQPEKSRHRKSVFMTPSQDTVIPYPSFEKY